MPSSQQDTLDVGWVGKTGRHHSFRGINGILVCLKNIWDQFQISDQEMNRKNYTDPLFHCSWDFFPLNRSIFRYHHRFAARILKITPSVDGRKLANIFWVLNFNPAMVGWWNLPWRPSTCTNGMFESSIIIGFKTYPMDPYPSPEYIGLMVPIPSPQ